MLVDTGSGRLLDKSVQASSLELQPSQTGVLHTYTFPVWTRAPDATTFFVRVLRVPFKATLP